MVFGQVVSGPPGSGKTTFVHYNLCLKNSPPSLTAWKKGVELAAARKIKQSMYTGTSVTPSHSVHGLLSGYDSRNFFGCF
nr:hypothetical protein [Tanacetum cinerariifolium]